MYITRWYKAGEYLFIRNYSPRCYGAPGKRRTKRMRNTPKAMDKYNNTKRSEKLQMLMLVNFDKGYHVTLDYPKDKRPETYKEAEDNLKKSLYKVSRRLKKQGKQFKYISITERGKRAAALHHHVIIEADPEVQAELMAVWGNHIKFSRMYEEGAYKELADYLCKIETKEEQTKGKSKYHRSRNLKEPLQRTAFAEGQIRDDPVIPDGYRLIPDTLFTGVNDVLGIKYQRYTLRRSPDLRPKRPVSVPNRTQKCRKREKPSIWQSLKSLFKKRRP